jgi:hypothetical protein
MGRGLTSGPVWRERPPDLQTQGLTQTTGDQKFPIRGSWTLPTEQQWWWTDAAGKPVASVVRKYSINHARKQED